MFFFPPSVKVWKGAELGGHGKEPGVLPNTSLGHQGTGGVGSGNWPLLHLKGTLREGLSLLADTGKCLLTGDQLGRHTGCHWWWNGLRDPGTVQLCFSKWGTLGHVVVSHLESQRFSIS